MASFVYGTSALLQLCCLTLAPCPPIEKAAPLSCASWGDASGGGPRRSGGGGARASAEREGEEQVKKGKERVEQDVEPRLPEDDGTHGNTRTLQDPLRGTRPPGRVRDAAESPRESRDPRRRRESTPRTSSLRPPGALPLASPGGYRRGVSGDGGRDSLGRREPGDLIQHGEGDRELQQLYSTLPQEEPVGIVGFQPRPVRDPPGEFISEPLEPIGAYNIMQVTLQRMINLYESILGIPFVRALATVRLPAGFAIVSHAPRFAPRGRGGRLWSRFLGRFECQSCPLGVRTEIHVALSPPVPLQTTLGLCQQCP